MILQALCQLAADEGLIEDPDFEVKPVSWVVRLDHEGRLQQITDQRVNLNEGTKRKEKWAGKPTLVPRQPIRTSGDAAFFLVDKSEYVFGFDPDKKRLADKLQARLGLFREQVVQCAEATADPSVRAVARCLARIAEDPAPIRAAFEQQPWAANDLFAFEVGLDTDMVHLRPGVRQFWKSRRSQVPTAPSESPVHCLVTGQPMSNVGLFPLLKKVPGGTSSGVSLVSFNAKAFESYGLSGNENAPVSREAAEQSATALNRLLHEAYPNPHEPGTTLPRRHVRIGSDTAVCFWAASTAQDVQEFTNAVPNLLEGDNEDSVKAMYHSVWYGGETPIAAPSAFYVLVLSGAQGRAIVRDWIETTLAETVAHLRRHFADLKIVRNARPKKGSQATPVVPLRWLMESLSPQGKADSLPPSLEAGFLRAAFTGLPYPLQILQRALVRARVESGRNEWLDAARCDARAALIKGVLSRRRSDPQASQRYPEVPPAMNPNLQSEGYVLGLLLAVLERLQALALGDVNASIVDRYFSAASAAPRSVFVRLLKNAKHHERKAMDAEERRQRGFVIRLSRLIDHVCSRFKFDTKHYPPQSHGIPSHLDLEQQGLFVLGYHQMRHWLWLSNEERQAWETEHPDAPGAFRWSKKDPAEEAGEAA